MSIAFFARLSLFCLVLPFCAWQRGDTLPIFFISLRQDYCLTIPPHQPRPLPQKNKLLISPNTGSARNATKGGLARFNSMQN